DLDKIALYTRADFPHDNWWVKAKFTFSDGTEEVVEMEKSVKPHLFSLERKNITWLKLSDLIKADDPSPFPALTQIEVYGKDSK
ncbi:carbohydrate-binding protein, partial [Clostridioides difficile]|nr:carbohydrate-binding protein [Clostridioides difficile]